MRAVKAGESGENAARALEQLADLMEEAQQRHFAIRAALAYPRMLVTLLAVLVWVVFGLVVPGFAHLIVGMNLSLPLITRMTLAASRLVTSPATITLMLGLVVAAHLVLSGRQGSDAWLLRLPFIGPWMQRQEAVTWMAWLDYFLVRDVPLDEAVRLAADPCRSRAFREILHGVGNQVTAGQSLAAALGGTRRFPPFATWLVACAERGEFAPGHMRRASAALHRDLESGARQGIALLEPMAVGCVGVLAFVVVVGLFAPLYQLVGSLQCPPSSTPPASSPSWPVSATR